MFHFADQGWVHLSPFFKIRTFVIVFFSLFRINITLRGGHYSDQSGNKVRTWYWPNDLQRKNPSVKFKPVFLSLNQNVGVRILGQDKVVISFLAMGKQAKINIGTKVEVLYFREAMGMSLWVAGHS